jgi:hypothetical protein
MWPKGRTMDQELFKIHKLISKRYKSLIKDKDWEAPSTETSKTHIIKMLNILETDNLMTEDKASRFLGYIQGVLTFVKVLSVEEERKFTRPLFQKYYKKRGLTQKTISL